MKLDCAYIQRILTNQGVKFSKGLNDDEIVEIESLYGFKFPPDLKELLMYALPVSKGFVNWRDKSEKNIKHIKKRFNWPLEGMIFDIKNNEFWMDDWGEKPNSLKDAIEIATKEFKKAPKLIPIFSHRYISDTPSESGNPIYSVYQTDIIFYGDNLTTYFKVEFDLMDQQDIDFDNIKEIPFWSNLVG
ncbi:SMI1/KNR4 family protein [Neobacillus pocheonensis]|uniref:SMI1/KNR4 family protein n=1 Tax=Neobacillus pocheonensis TaxID=363869 RepID=UPI003D27C70E